MILSEFSVLFGLSLLLSIAYLMAAHNIVNRRRAGYAKYGRDVRMAIYQANPTGLTLHELQDRFSTNVAEKIAVRDALLILLQTGQVKAASDIKSVDQILYVYNFKVVTPSD